jgi:hypothetical protein
MRLPKSLAVRVCGVAAAAAIAVTGATTAANASTAPPAAAGRIPTTLTIGNTKPVAHKHQTTAIVFGHLTALGTFVLGHERITLQRLGPKGHWRFAQEKLTNRHGNVFFRVHVFKKPATFRLVFKHTRHFKKAVSFIDTISPASNS